MRQFFFIFSIVLASHLIHTTSAHARASSEKPLRVGVVGLVHSHVHWILGREDRGDIEIVGIVEPNRSLAERYAKRHGYPMELVYNTIEEMIEKAQPEAVTAFNTIYDHLKVVQVCAPEGIHVMVEKPLAVNLEHAVLMEKLAKQHDIHLLTNYETTWYGSNHRAYQMIHEERAIGSIRKIMVNDGHPGPKEIGVNQEFLEWLTDPVQNGGGALTDFGCYGANLITWLMKGLKPISVTAVIQQFKPEIYPKVEDEATIILTYPKSQGIIQASWNWPVHRKDIEIYGTTGYIVNANRENMRVRLGIDQQEQKLVADPLPKPVDDPFSYLAAVVRGAPVGKYDLSSLENNMMVMEILEAAKLSARTGKTIFLE
ncbi:MAG: Gfo/Idh/MocA family oxidoreductase [Cytophagales bacterium]|nr:Gfo/Idh/MocA family oxidoreductase [Cytophagales bacterium]